MDVSATRLPDRIEPTPPPSLTAALRARDAAMAPRSDPPPGPAPSERWEPRSTLKFSLTAADVDARFEIHEGTSRVTVTMYERETGEVLREIPSRRVLDAIASLAAAGHHVDTTS